jgi:nitrate reductase NapAB chaperone NapD
MISCWRNNTLIKKYVMYKNIGGVIKTKIVFRSNNFTGNAKHHSAEQWLSKQKW